MDANTKMSFIRYYARRSDSELIDDKAKIGEHLKNSKVKDLTNIKECIAIINNEIKTRMRNHP